MRPRCSKLPSRGDRRNSLPERVLAIPWLQSLLAMKSLLALSLVSLIQLSAIGAPANAAPGDDVAILARGAWPFAKADPTGPRTARGWIIRTENELLEAAGPLPAAIAPKALLADLAKRLKIDEIDFNKHTLIVVSSGVKNTGGHRVEITRVEKGAKGNVAHWLATGPKGGFVTQAFTHPTAVVIISKLDGPILFEPAFDAVKNPPVKPKLRPAPKPQIKPD